MAKPLGLLAWIAGYKLIKATIAILGGIVVLRLGRTDLVAMGHRWLVHIGLDPEGRIGTRFLAGLGHFDPRRLYWTAALFFAYTILYCVEAVGLVLEKRWAEWLVIFQTGILLPIELYEMIYRPGPIKAAALCLSFGVILYLVWRIRDDAPEDAGGLPR
jgi:uncharacterized membrane protein (DUF2068 family)